MDGETPGLGGGPLTRRRWLARIAVAGIASLGADEPEADRKAVADVRVRARKAGLKDVRTSTLGHYVGVGDAPDGFRAGALRLCESLGETFRSHFQARGFAPRFPPEKMVVVTLAGKASYEAFKGEPVGEAEGGHYDPASNRLVVFDARAGAEPNAVDPDRVNTFTLVHEAVHQLTFNTGLLAREGDVPVALSEGLATYCESWQLRNARVGQVNRLRLRVLTEPQGDGSWISVERLLTDDGVLTDPETEQLAYAESWLLVYDLMKTPARTKRLRAYLDAIRPRRDPGGRLDDARKTLGDLDRLDAELKRAGRNLL